MDTRRYGEVSVLYVEPETYAKLLHLAETGPGRPGGVGYDPDDPWHGLIVEPHSYGCWVHTGVVEDGGPDGLPASLLAVLREGHDSGADWVLLDADLEPLLDLPTFEHPDGPSRPGRFGAMPAPPRRVVFAYSVPVHVEVEDDRVVAVVVIDETPVRDPTLVEGDPADLARAVAAFDDGQSWPSWRFGY